MGSRDPVYRSEMHTFAVYAVICGVFMISGGAAVAAIAGVASPPEIRVITGVLLWIGAGYFMVLSPKRKYRPGWLVPMFLIVGSSFVLPSAGSHIPGPERVDKMFISIGYIATGACLWYWMAVQELQDVRRVPTPIDFAKWVVRRSREWRRNR